MEELCQDILEQQGVMIVPGSLFDFFGNHFRIGLGRKNFGEAIGLVNAYLKIVGGSMNYSFLVDTYESERLKTLNVWSMFRDDEMDIRPHPMLERDRTAHEHMVHQCLSEDKWFRTMFGIEVGAPPLPDPENRLAFIRRYADDSEQRVARLAEKDETWWEQKVAFFDTTHIRAWIMVRRVAHTAHHRGEQTTLLRLMGRPVHSVYGPSVDTGGLPIHNAVTINAYSDIASLLEGESQGGRKAPLPGPGDHPSTERPDR